MSFNHWPIWNREVRVWGRRLRACSLDRLAYLILHKAGRMGRQEAAYFEKLIQPGMTVVEAGSNLGLYTLLFSKLVGAGGVVHACEPDPRLFAALAANVERNGASNVRLHPYAIGAHSEERVLRRGGINSGDNRLEAAADSASDAGPESARVQVRSLDDLLEGQKVDFIKIDVQGWEAEVFKGMSRLAAANPRVRVFFEVWPYGLRRAGCEPVAWLRSLVDAGWRLTSTPDGSSFSAEEAAAYDGNSKRFFNLLAMRSDLE